MSFLSILLLDFAINILLLDYSRVPNKRPPRLYFCKIFSNLPLLLGPSSSVVEKARKDLNAYSFLFWIDEYLKPRQTKSNVKETNIEMSADEEENSEAAENTPSFKEFDDQSFDE